MKFGYFFLGVSQDEVGSSGKVEIRPIALGFPTESGARVVIRIPLAPSHAEQTLTAIGADCLQAARELLPEAMLRNWSAKWGTQTLLGPTFPPNASELWNDLGSAED